MFTVLLVVLVVVMMVAVWVGIVGRFWWVGVGGLVGTVGGYGRPRTICQLS